MATRLGTEPVAGQVRMFQHTKKKMKTAQDALGLSRERVLVEVLRLGVIELQDRIDNKPGTIAELITTLNDEAATEAAATS